MKNYYPPYQLDIEYQLKTYVNVGMDYGNRKTVNLGWLGNISRWRRKKKNKDEKIYKVCKTYSEWKSYVEECIPSERQCEKENFIRWLMLKKRHAESYYDALKTIAIPVYVALLTILHIFCPDDSMIMYIAIPIVFFVVGMSTVILSNANDKIKFFEDFIEIVKGEKSN